MNRPSYLSRYLFDWESLDLVLGGRSALDSHFFIGSMNGEKQVQDFLTGYGLDYSDPVIRAELFGNFQESLQFIRRYFLVEGNPGGTELQIPNAILMITDISKLLLMATGNAENTNAEETLWAEMILKVMHTILHIDKDLRSNYFSVVQTQIFDRFYKYIYRDEEENLFFGEKGDENNKIQLVDFETKSTKTRDSVIIKLLHKAENVAEELFDRVGVRIITENKFDTLRTVKFMLEKFIIIPHNIKPSRSLNSMVNLDKFKDKYGPLIRKSLRDGLSEKEFLEEVAKEVEQCSYNSKSEDERNSHSSSSYQSIQFTCRHLIRYKNPFLHEFHELRKEAKKEAQTDNEISKKILSMDMSLISRDIRFFYPYEVQIVDQKSHQVNTEGEASHLDYKKSQIQTAMIRVCKSLLDYKGITY